MFDPCTDQKYRGDRIPCVGKPSRGQCDCELDQLRRENEHLRIRIKTELEPRLKIERRSYDLYVTNTEEEQID